MSVLRFKGIPHCHSEHAVLDFRGYEARLKVHFKGVFMEDRVGLIMTMDKVKIGNFVHDFGRW